jgi:hypothetical protein
MKKRHDESKVLAHFRYKWNAELDFGRKIITLPKNSPLSIHDCGKLDYLANYCGWRYVFVMKEKKIDSADKKVGLKKKDKKYYHKMKNKN